MKLHTTFAECKSNHDIVTIAERLGIEIIQITTGYAKCICPFHSDGNASFVLLREKDLAHCAVPGCFEMTDMFGLVAAHQGLDKLIQAKDWIENNAPATPREKPKREKRTSVVYDQDFLRAKVREALRHQRIAAPYIQARGLPEAVMTDYRIGALPAWKPKRTVYKKSNGDEVQLLPATRIALPWEWEDIIHGIKLRLDMQSVRETLELTHADYLRDIRDDLALKRGIRSDEVTEAALIAALFGDKYMSYGRFGDRIFNSRYLVRKVGGQLEWPRIPLLLGSEGEFDVMTHTHIAGLPSIGIKNSCYLADALKHVDAFVFIQDRDREHTRPDGSKYVPGEIYASDIIAASGRTLGENIFVLTPPAPHKDSNDLALAGQLIDWLYSSLGELGISPKSPKIPEIA